MTDTITEIVQGPVALILEMKNFWKILFFEM